MEHSAVVHQRNEGFGDLLAVAMGTSVILWAVAYVGLSPAVNVPGAAMAVFALIGLVIAGVAIGRLTARGVSGGIKLGLLLGFINFLIVASLHGKDTTAEALRFGAKWVVAFTVIAVALAAIGAWIGSRFPRANAQPIRWTSRLAAIVAITVLPLLISGGIVTGLEAGLAVPDWLTTFDYPMMFYPMAEMQRVPGVYAEHFHRLWGLLVGLAVILLAVQLHRVDSRAWLRWMSIAIILAVIVQGVLGAGWVLSTQLRSLAIMHGVFGQLVFAAIVAVAAFSSATWLSQRAPTSTIRASTDRSAAITLFVLLVLQLALGALYRHLRRDAGDPGVGMHVLWTHIFLATIVLAVGIFAAGRAWGLHGDQPVLPRLGKSILHLMGVQILLGIAALFAVLHRGQAEAIPMVELVFTTAHQAVGAILLALAGLHVVWTRRLLSPPENAVQV